MFANLLGPKSRTGLIAVLLLLVSVVGGCGKSDNGTPDSNSSDSNSTDTTAAKRHVPSDTLVVKGLYMRMPGDDALEACKELVASSKDLVVVDFRDGIEREKDEATKNAEKKEYEENVKKAEFDVDRFMKWNGGNGEVYTPSAPRCCGDKLDEKDFKPSVEIRRGSSEDDTIFSMVLANAMLELAGKHGYQVEWMLPGKRKGGTQNEPHEPKFVTVGKFELPANSDTIYECCLPETKMYNDAIKSLYDKGMQVHKDHEKRVFFRLILQDAKGNPVDKTKLATELAMCESKYFKALDSKREKLELAEKEVDSFLTWVELGDRGGRWNKFVRVFDPSDPRTEEAKEKELSEKMVEAKRKEIEMQKEAVRSRNVAIKEINMMEAQMRDMEQRKSALDREIALQRSSMKDLADSAKVLKARSKKDAYAKRLLSEKKMKLDEMNEKYVAAKEKREKLVAEINVMDKTIRNKKAAMINADRERMSVARGGKRAPNQDKAESTNGTTDLKFLQAVMSKERGAEDEFQTIMTKMAKNCKVMVEWAVLTEPADELVQITETFVIPKRDRKGVDEFVKTLDKKIGRWSGGDSRKRLFFEKDLDDVGSPAWFRLVLKNTNGVEVAKEEVVKNWLAARGHFPPSDKLKIAKKNLIQISFKKDGGREDRLKGLCFVWIDDKGNVKEVYFNEDGMARFFNAGDLSSKEFAQSLVDNYAEIPSLESKVQREDPGRGFIQTTTWVHKDPRGFQVKLFDRAYFNNNGQRYTARMIENDPEVNLALSLVDKSPKRYLSITAVKPDSERKFD